MQPQEALKQTQEDSHYNTVISAITEGRIVPFLGAGANLCDRPEGVEWERGRYLPSGGELASYLATRFGYTQISDLARVSQFVSLLGGGQAALYEALRYLLTVDYPPPLIHQLLAVLPALARDRGFAPPYQLIVTTNYDDVLERTFHLAHEEFDVISYVAPEPGKHDGIFRHWSYAFEPNKKPEKRSRQEGESEADYQLYLARYHHELAEYQRQQEPGQLERDKSAFWEPKNWPPTVESHLVKTPNEYTALSLEQRPVILKIHGAVDRITPADHDERLDSFIITEDDYIDYLTRKDISELMPMKLTRKLHKSNFWFLGYSLRDWNLRVILRRIWGEQKLRYNSWAIQLNPEDLDQVFWTRRDVQILNKPLHDYVCRLILRLGAGSYITRLNQQLQNLTGGLE
jgi:SIR2-like domain